jgi:hypothetical protein
MKPSRTRTGPLAHRYRRWPHARPHAGGPEFSREIEVTSQHRLPSRKRPALAMNRQQAR